MSDHRIKQSFEKADAYKGALQLIELLNAEGFEAYVAGGAVRDALLGLEIHDFDLTTSATPDEMKKVFEGFKTLEHGIEFGTLTVLVEGEPYEITTYRGESEYEDGRRPNEVKFIKSKDEDLKRRDFTINAMLYHSTEGLYDPFGGEGDLKNKMIKTVGDSVERFSEDALRILRMMRFSVVLGFEIEPECLKASQKLLPSLMKLSRERVFSEIDKMLSKKINMVQFEKLQEFYLGGKVEFVELAPFLSSMEKAYLLSKFNEKVLNLSKYVLPKKLKKDFDFFLSLKNLDSASLKKVFVKKIEQEKFDSNGILLFNRLFLDCLKSGVKDELSIGFNKESLTEDPFLAIDQKLQNAKTKLAGAELGAALLKIKIDHFWQC